ncbi:MAG: GntR family transcriptional regulator [Candidatus Eremiobacteraeota bacterium]|nr:GntR family transcriptional regulator [Candidatus Eremiobacteraeota bacterium]
MSVGKSSVRADLVARVRSLIVGQTLSPGARINETQLSLQLGVSRSPLREALSSLEAESLIRSEHDRGFFVPMLSSQEVRELYPIGRELDLLALRTINHYSDATIRKLSKLNRAFLKARRRAEAARNIDTEFHSALIGACPNSRLLATLAPIKTAMERYERLYMSDESDVVRSAEHHQRIINALLADDIEAAVVALADNWDYGFERIMLMKLDAAP